MGTIYLDHAATTPLRPEVAAAMAPFLQGLVGNPSSVHRWGRAARSALEDARERTAALLRVRSDEIRFVRGGTESVNVAVLGRAAWLRERGDGEVVFLRSRLEHSAVRESMDAAGALGVRSETFEVDASGRADLPTARELSARGVEFVSCQWVNQETGMILPVPDLARECNAAGVPLHVDAVQAAGRIPLELDEHPIAMVSLSGHKLGGPRSTGILVLRKGTELRPLMFGGGQERGLRPGTEDVAGAVGIARALDLSLDTMEVESPRLADLRAWLEAGLVGAIPGTRVHAGGASRAPHILGLGIPDLPMDVLPGALDLEGIGASAGSACMSGSTEVSPTLRALYGDDASGYAPLRLSLGWTTSAEEVSEALRKIPPIVERIRVSAGVTS
ncbi:MAG: cysteine desulfurase [Gemmatimonadetes bacterium]|nr:cysteine desulfurase [Gemmatimonadota bacterium]